MRCDWDALDVVRRGETLFTGLEQHNYIYLQKIEIEGCGSRVVPGSADPVSQDDARPCRLSLRLRGRGQENDPSRERGDAHAAWLLSTRRRVETLLRAGLQLKRCDADHLLCCPATRSVGRPGQTRPGRPRHCKGHPRRTPSRELFTREEVRPASATSAHFGGPPQCGTSGVPYWRPWWPQTVSCFWRCGSSLGSLAPLVTDVVSRVEKGLTRTQRAAWHGKTERAVGPRPSTLSRPTRPWGDGIPPAAMAVQTATKGSRSIAQSIDAIPSARQRCSATPPIPECAMGGWWLPHLRRSGSSMPPTRCNG